MTTISYCSLEEALGEPIKSNEEENTVSYSGGNQAGNELHPVFNNNHEKITQNQPVPNKNFELPSNSMFDNTFHKDNNSNEVNNVSTALVRMEDVNKEELWKEFMKFLEYKKKNNNEIDNISVQESFSNIKSISNDNSYIDLLILILFGIVIIFIMDSFVRLGKKMKD